MPWNWQTISLSSLACGLRCITLRLILIIYVSKADNFSDSFVLTGLIEAATIPYSGIVIEELSLDEKAEILFADQAYEPCFLICYLLTNNYKVEVSPVLTCSIVFVHCRIATTVVLTVLLSLTKSFSPLPDDIYRYGNQEEEFFPCIPCVFIR